MNLSTSCFGGGLPVALQGPSSPFAKEQHASHRFMGMPVQNCPTWLSNPLWAFAEVTEKQGVKEGRLC